MSRLPAAMVLILATAALIIFTYAMRATPAGRLPQIGAALLAVPMYLLLALFASRKRTPDLWIGPGSFERYHVAQVDLPAGEGNIPALMYTPGESSRSVIVVVHGAGAHKTFYNWPIFDALLRAGFAVCAIDLDGHGDNTRVLDFPDVIEDVQVVVEWLRPEWDFVGVAGISLGGCVAARAVADGVRVDALAIFEAPATVEFTRQVERHEYWTLLRFGTWGLHRFGGTLPLIRAWRTHPTLSRISTVDLIERLDIHGSLRGVEAPLWLCYGGSDWVVPLWQVREIQEAAPRGTPLVVLSRATHLSTPIDPRGLRALTRWLLQVQRRAVAEPRPAGTPAMEIGAKEDVEV